MAILGGSRLGRTNTNMSQPHQNVQQQLSANRENEPSEKNVTSKVERNQRDSVLFGNELKQSAPEISDSSPVMYFKGKDNQGIHRNIPISKSVLSRHLMLIGGIGTGKTNAFFQMLGQLNESLTQDDVMIIFDTKGDFYKEFYRPGDVVISNDETAVGSDGSPDYWNIFNEIADGEQQYASVLEIAKSLFKEACEKTNQVFSQMRPEIFLCLLCFIFYDTVKNLEIKTI